MPFFFFKQDVFNKFNYCCIQLYSTVLLYSTNTASILYLPLLFFLMQKITKNTKNCVTFNKAFLFKANITNFSNKQNK